MNEIWKDIPNYEGLYQASTKGRIRTVEGKTTSNALYAVRHWKSRILKGRGKGNTGYRVSLWKDGQVKDYLVARLVALTFIGNPPEGYTVNHKDGNRFNNSIENLEWLSLEDNIKHAFVTGLMPTQKQIAVVNNGVRYDFRSYAELDRFIKRRVGYTSGAIKKGRPIKDIQGNIYEII